MTHRPNHHPARPQPDRLLGGTSVALAVLLALATAAAGGCDGYGELSVPHREDAPAVVEATSLRAGTAGLVQLLAQVPADASGPVVVVGSPVAEPSKGEAAWGGSTDSPYVQGWAWGPCPGLGGPHDAPGPGEVRLCAAVWTPWPTSFALALVVEARGAARRFTARTEVVW